jgi:phosphopentomutase
MAFKRVFLVIIDSFGVGAMENAALYNDEGADTFGHIDEIMDPFQIPNLMHLGLGQIHEPKHAIKDEHPQGYYTKMKEASVGKDTITGHWEMMGIQLDEAFLSFTDTGFPKELIDELEKQTGHTVIGNKAASGTEILKELGEEELASNSKKMIVYTSADSVLQICGNEQSMGLDELYRVCEIARDITMKPEWKVARVIARPYIGSNASNFERTANRRDLALAPVHETDLDALKQKGLDVIGIGKISDIFSGQGLTNSLHSQSSVHGMQQTIELLDQDFSGLVFTNLVDFDAKWGHRRNPVGYGKELESFDVLLKEFMDGMKEDDLLILSADHGNDPVHHGTDHTKEKVPLMIYSPSFAQSGELEEQENFACIGATILDNFGVKKPEACIGKSLLDKIK